MIYTIFQAVLITAIVAFSLWQVAKKLFPARVHALTAVVFHAAGHDAPVIAPAKGCGDGCGSCKGCSVNFKID